MARRHLKMVAPILLVIVLVPIGFVVLRSWNPLDELRQRGGVETVYKDGVWIRHEFQFSEPCGVMQTRLADWKDRLESSGREYTMTDMEDRETGPREWALLSNLSLNPVVALRPGNNCGFIISLTQEPSGLEKLVNEVRKFMHLR